MCKLYETKSMGTCSMKKAVFCTALTSFFVLLAACTPSQPDKQIAHKPDFQRGMHIYLANCGECHDTGRLGAPTLDDVEDWDERSWRWQALLKDHATKGFMSMPAKGGKNRLTDRDVSDALYYMDIKIRANEE